MATFNETIMTLSGPIQHKRGTSAALAASNYVPAAGEIIIATDTGEMRSGDGVNTWSNLPSYDGTEIANNLTSKGYVVIGNLPLCSTIPANISSNRKKWWSVGLQAQRRKPFELIYTRLELLHKKLQALRK